MFDKCIDIDISEMSCNNKMLIISIMLEMGYRITDDERKWMDDCRFLSGWKDGEMMFSNIIPNHQYEWQCMVVDVSIFSMPKDELLVMVKLGYNPFTVTDYVY